MEVLNSLLNAVVFMMTAVTSNGEFSEYFLYLRMNGYKCSGLDRLFNETGLEWMSCAMSCQLYSGCKSFMFKEEGGHCCGCNRVYTYPSEPTANVTAAVDYTYSISKDYETIFRIANDSMLTDEGRVEMRFNGTWGTVCDDRFWNLLTGHEVVNMDVLCASLGFNGGGMVLNKTTYLMANSTGVPIWLDNVECTGTEQNIAECPHAGFGISDCTHIEDVGIRCFN